MSLPDVLPEQGGLAERYRALRSAVEAAWDRDLTDDDRPGRTILVVGVEQTAAMIGTRLAVALARTERRTLLIDADLRAPRCQRLLGMHDQPLTGLADWLRDAASDNPAPAVETTVPQLMLVPAGRTDNRAADLMTGERLAALAAWLKAEPARSVIVGPPLASSGEALPLVRHVDAVLLVVVPGRTIRPAATRARDAVLGAGGRILGVVLGDQDGPK